MPTGYTYKITEEGYQFNQYVWDCARAFSPFIHMRDEPNSAKITMPEEFSYYQDRLDEDRLELEKYEAMSLAEAEIERDIEYDKCQFDAKKYLAKMMAESKKFHTMHAKVLAWNPPTPAHVELRSFMLQQLEETMKYDCNVGYYEKVLLEPKESVQDWLDERIGSAQRAVVRRAASAQNEKDLFAQNMKWIQDLKDSVPMP